MHGFGLWSENSSHEKMQKSSDNNGGPMAYKYNALKNENLQWQATTTHKNKNSNYTKKGKTTHQQPSTTKCKYNVQVIPKIQGFIFSARRKKSRKSAIWLGQGDQGSTVWVWFRCGFWNVCDAWDHILSFWTKFGRSSWYAKKTCMMCWLTLLTQAGIISFFMINWSTTYSYSIHAFNSLEHVVWCPSSFHESRDGNFPRSYLKKSSCWKDLTIIPYNSTVKINQHKYICWSSLMGLIFEVAPHYWQLMKLRLSTNLVQVNWFQEEGAPCFDWKVKTLFWRVQA